MPARNATTAAMMSGLSIALPNSTGVRFAKAVNLQRVERAIADDLAFLAAHARWPKR
jgi:hypothetical protein